ncbi:MAG: peptidoglycan DD-metalloendopeptidase family protein [Muribaculaceae bacterium]|nr:peptidoglycan DD-metalloendopeptidase family protein [Muribaculaceae bacterium]
MNCLIKIFVALATIAALQAQAATGGAPGPSLEEATRNLDEITSLIQEQEHNVVHLEAQLDNINKQQRIISDSINRHQWQLAQLRGQYAQVVRNLNAHSSAYDRLAYIFSAASLSQAWQRASYLRQLARWREERSNTLAATVHKYKDQQQRLKKLGTIKQASLDHCNATRIALQTRLDQEEQYIASLGTQATQLTAVVNEKRAQADKLAMQLDNITAATRNPQDIVPDNAKNLLDGKLPNPVNGHYTVTGHYGRQHHPTLAHVWTSNNGIDLACSAGSCAQSVADGTVTGVYNTDMKSCVVMVRHGDYITVYGGLSTLSVKEGQQVVAGQALGEVATHPLTRVPTLHFELRQGHNTLDPEPHITP